MKFIEPLASVFSAPFKRSEEFKLLSSAIDNIAQGDKPWMMERIVSSLPNSMSRYEQRKLRKMVEAHSKIIEGKIYRQALCRFSLGEDLDMEKEARNARSLGENEHRDGLHQAAVQSKFNVIAAKQNQYIQHMNAADRQAFAQQAANYAGQQMAAAQQNYVAQQNTQQNHLQGTLGGKPWEAP
jgi:hypothetical protein